MTGVAEYRGGGIAVCSGHDFGIGDCAAGCGDDVKGFGWVGGGVLAVLDGAECGFGD